MTAHDDFDRVITGWFEADARGPIPAAGLDRALDVTRLRRPRPAWLAGPGSHWVSYAIPGRGSLADRTLERLSPRWSTALVLLLILTVVVGGLVVVGSLMSRPSPLPIRLLSGLAYGLDGDIIVADWDGSNPRIVADGDPNAPCGGFVANDGLMSPDGRHLAFRTGWSDTCDGSVVVTDLDGIVKSTFPGAGWNIAWSPDSARVVTWIELGKTIGVYGVDGALKATLDGSRMCCGDYDPIWSPDGSDAILVKSRGSGGTVWELPVDGDTPRPVPADDPRSTMRLAWNPVAYSPDGSRAALISRYDALPLTPQTSGYPSPVPRFGDRLVVAAADGSQPRVLLELEQARHFGSDMIWSPTGERIAYVVYRDLALDADGFVTLRQSDLRLVDVASGSATTLATGRGSEPLGLLGFSPEGDRVLFGQTDENGRSSVRSVNTDGTEVRTLVDGTAEGWWLTAP